MAEIAVTASLHVALLVTDLTRAQHFYETVLGLTPAERSLRFSGIWYQLGSFQIHLIESPNWRVSLPTPEKLGRNPHLALAVADLSAVKAALTAANYRVQKSASGRAALFTQDPDGNVIELSQAA